MKKRLEKLLQTAQDKKATYETRCAASDISVEELRSIYTNIDSVNDEINALNEMISELNEAEQRSQFDPRDLSKIGQGSTVEGNTELRAEQDFMDFITRSNTNSTTASAVIPSTLMGMIKKELKVYGDIYARVKKTHIKGNVAVPVLDVLGNDATWLNDEGASADVAINANEKVVFNMFGCEFKISQSIFSSIQTLDEFKNTFVSLAKEKILIAVEKAIISGDGSNQPKGIANTEGVVEVQMADKDIQSFTAWKKNVFAKIKKAYQNGVLIMSQGTFEAYMDMTDSTGRPLLTAPIEADQNYRFRGKEIITVESDVLPDFDTAEVGDVVAVYCDLSKYVLNEAQSITVVKWTDNDKNLNKTKATLYVDGQLLDKNAALVIKKK